MIKSRQNNSQNHQELIRKLEENQDFISIKKELPHIAKHISEIWGTIELLEQPLAKARGFLFHWK